MGKRFFTKEGKLLDLRDCFIDASVEVHYKKLALEIAISLIANAIARCEFKTFDKGKRARLNKYYMLNVEPNKNDNATAFWKQVVRKIIYEKECLVIIRDGELHVVDYFSTKAYVFRENEYKDIQIANLALNRGYQEGEVLHFKLNDANIIALIDSMYVSYGKLLGSAMNYYRRKNNKRIVIKGEFLRAQDDDTQEELDKLMENQLSNWFNPDKEGVAFQLQEGLEFEDLSDSKAGAQGLSDSRDISNIIDDIFNYVAMSLHVPRGMLKGDLADVESVTDNFIAFAVNPIAEMMNDEINRKIYTKEDYLSRTYCKIDTKQIKITDVAKLATAVDKLFAIGGYSINDVIDEIGGEPIEEEWADKRFVTKNYELAEYAVRGGEKDE